MNKYLYEDLYVQEEKHWWHIAKRKTCTELASKFLKNKSAKILDIGCGTGKNVEAFSRLGTVFGIDNSKEALKFCKEKRGLKNIKFGKAENTGFGPEQFDMVSMLDVLEHTDDLKTLKEARKILKGNGLLLITVPAYKWMWSNWDVALHHKRRYTSQDLAKILEANGFRVLKSSYLYSFLLLPVFLIRKIKNTSTEGEYSSDFKIGLPLMNVVFGMVADFERIIALWLGVPFGLSIIVVAKKLAAD